MQVKKQRKGILDKLAVGIQISPAIMEINMEVPQNTQIRPTYDPVIPSLNITKRLVSKYHKDLYISTCKA